MTGPQRASVRLLDDPWPSITAACRRGRADVAVAYVGQGANALLPLRKGSKLVVDASEAAVKSGQTDPRELLKFHRKGVEVFSLPRLHAKVYAFAGVAFVGSANVSRRSSDLLVEAAVAVSARPAISLARRFVLGAARSPLGEGILKKLAKIYRPPQVPEGGHSRRRRATMAERRSGGAPLHVVQLKLVNWGDLERAADEKGAREANRKKRRGWELESFGAFGWKGLPADGEVLRVTTHHRNLVTIARPSRVLAAAKVRGRRQHVVQVEVPPRHRLRKLSVVRGRLPAVTAKRLKRNGRLAPRHADAIRELWT